MKKTITVIAASVLAVSLPGIAYAQSSASASATGSTTIVQPITITKTADLSFGRLVKPVMGSGEVFLAESVDTLDVEGGVFALDTASRAKFTIEGEGGQAVSVSVPATLTMSKGADTIDLALLPDLASAITLSGSAGTAGSASLNVGGIFNLRSDQATGVYSGSFTVTVAYQ